MALYKDDIVDIELNSGSIHRSFVNRTIGEGDTLANRFGVRLFRNGQPENVNGTCEGYFIRSDGATVPLTGYTYDNVALVALNSTCYACEGQFALAIKVSGNGVTGTMRIVDGVVENTMTGSAVDPGTIIPSIEELIAAINAAVASIPADYSSLWESLAPEFQSDRKYYAGEYCTYDGKMYKFRTDHAAGAWNSGHVLAVDIGGQLYNALMPVEQNLYDVKASQTIDNRFVAVGGGNVVVALEVSGSSVALIDAKKYIGQYIRIKTQRITGSSYVCNYIISGENLAALKYEVTSDSAYFDKWVYVPENAVTLYINYATAGSGYKVQTNYTGDQLRGIDYEVTAMAPTADLAYTQHVAGKYVVAGSSGVAVFESETSDCDIYNVDGMGGKIIVANIERTTDTKTVLLFTNGTSGPTGIIESINEPRPVISNGVYRIPEGAKILYVNYLAAGSGADLKIVQKAQADQGAAGGGINDRIYGKSCICFGDSITWLDGTTYASGKESGQTCVGYESYLRQAGMSVTNRGFSGQALPYIVQNGIMDTNFENFDYVTITSGANDSRKNVTVGTIQPIGSTFDDTTFIGSLQKGIEHIYETNPTIKIMLITPLMGWIYSPDGYEYEHQGDGIVEERYAEAIKAVGAFYNIPVCDLYDNCGLNLCTRNWYINDPEPNPSVTPNPNPYYSLHPTNEGYARMSDVILTSIRGI